MILDSNCANDVNRYYKHTYVKFKEHGDTLFYIRNVNQYMLSGCNQDNEEFELYFSNEHPYELDYILPNKAYFQHGKVAALLCRIPAKQYQRGISEGNTSLVALTDKGFKPLEIGFPTLTPFVTKQQYSTLVDAVRNKSKWLSHALSSRFAYVPRTKEIHCDRTIVATFDNGIIIPRHPIFRPELIELAANHYKVA